MRLHEFKYAQEDELDENWKNWVAGGAMAASALGAGVGFNKLTQVDDPTEVAKYDSPFATAKADSVAPTKPTLTAKVDKALDNKSAKPTLTAKADKKHKEDQSVTGKAFAKKLTQVATALQVKPDDLLKVMHFETKGKLDPSITNNIGATGLIQFMPKTAQDLGTTTEELRRMTAVQQLDYVYEYFKTKVKPGSTASDIYIATLLPSAANLPNKTIIAQKGNQQLVPNAKFSKNRMWNQNPAFAVKGKQHYTVGDVRNRIDNHDAPTLATLAQK